MIGSSQARRKLLSGLGWAVSLASILYVGYLTASRFPDYADSFSNTAFLAGVALAGAIYSVSAALVSFAWAAIIASITQVRIRQAFLISSSTQILKYIPSNVLHLVGRYTKIRAQGASSASYVLSTTLEMVLIAGAAMSYALGLSPSLVERFIQIDSVNWISPFIPGAGLLASIGIAWAMLRRSSVAVGVQRLRAQTWIAVSVGLYAAFFLLNGAMLWLLASAIGNAKPDFVACCGMAAAAWFVGFVTPGAPAGLGVREVLLITGLQQAGVGADSVSITLGYRLATIAGDALLAVIATLWARQHRVQTP